MLREVCNLLQERGAMTTCDLAVHFETDESSMQGILQFLERKQRVYHEVLEPGKGCAGCRLATSCRGAAQEGTSWLWHAGHDQQDTREHEEAIV